MLNPIKYNFRIKLFTTEIGKDFWPVSPQFSRYLAVVANERGTLQTGTSVGIQSLNKLYNQGITRY